MLRGGFGARSAWIFLDQAFSSLGNFALGILVAASTDARSFGEFSLAYTLFLFAIEILRPLALEPLARSRLRNQRTTDDVSGAASLALLLGCGVSVILLIGSAFAPGAQAAMWALALGMPGLFLQDAVRYCYTVIRAPKFAALNDGIWTALVFAGAIPLVIGNVTSAWSFVAVWALAGTLAAILAVVHLRIQVSIRYARSYYQETKFAARRFLAEAVLEGSYLQIVLLAVSTFAGLEALGAMNGARILLGPIGVLYIGAAQLILTEGAVMEVRDRAQLLKLARYLSVGLTAFALAWVVVLELLPASVGQWILGDSWTSASAVLVPLGLFWASQATARVARFVLRACAATRRLLRVQGALSPSLLLAGSLGAYLGGAQGASFGLMTLGFLGALIWWQQMRTELRNNGER